ncbi:MAG: hypothetical protein NC213_08135 [Acetobacter sp.]|nr:hypothetical protein [Bacteroides sp.]MCM1341698.1 hypothetical protein [Acetobacter sp.]MCM1432364.1 hypothetical protein [Clostridiales bacterium]
MKEIINFLETNFNLDNYELPEEYNYFCLPLCLMDAIFSIGANYKSTQNVIDRFCDVNNLEIFKSNTTENYTIKEFINYIEKIGIQSFAENIVKNTQRTSSTNGILKAEAVFECAKVFDKNSIQTIDDFNSLLNADIEKEFKSVKGQGSGITFSYLKILCGDEKVIKPDRHIIRFLNEYGCDCDDAQSVINSVVDELSKSHNNINARKIDYIIWKYMSSK